jgi:hypothetical protein
VTNEILREFSLLHIFSCSAPQRQKYNTGSKLVEKNQEKDPCHIILIVGILREILPPKRKSFHFFKKIVGHILQGQMVKEWNVWGIWGLE